MEPPGVVRNTPGGATLPDWQAINDILALNTYTNFTYSLERDAYNGVHNWANGTISNPSTAPEDPIFWLLHAYVDYVWDRWQFPHDDVPLVSGFDAVLDPWNPVTSHGRELHPRSGLLVQVEVERGFDRLVDLLEGVGGLRRDRKAEHRVLRLPRSTRHLGSPSSRGRTAESGPSRISTV